MDRMTNIPKVALLLETSREYGRSLLRGVVQYVRHHGPWSLVISPGHFEQELPRLKWEGSGLIARISSPKLARSIRASGLPTVALEASFEEHATLNPQLKICEIRSDSPAIARLAAEHLLERGFRQFAYCGIPRCLWSQVRQETFTRTIALQNYPCEVYAHPRARADWQWDREQSILAAWLRGLPKPVGLMAANDDRGRKILQACSLAGLQVPEEVAVVGVDNDDLVCELSDPPLSSVALDLENTGYAAAALLDGLMSGRVAGYHQLPVRPLWVVARRSTDVVAQDDAAVAAAMAFIRDNAQRPIGVANVVKQTEFSRRALERRFEKAVGRSLHDEITRCRLSRAKRLLLETDLPVSEVAEASGFGNLKPMVRAFRAAESCSPHEFRCRDQSLGADAKKLQVFRI